MCLQMLEKKNTYEEKCLTLLANSARRCNAILFRKTYVCQPPSAFSAAVSILTILH